MVFDGDMTESKESGFGMTGDGCGCQYEDDKGGVAKSEGGDTDSAVPGCWRLTVTPVLAKTWGQLLTRPAGLLRTVGWILLNELYALARFKALDE